MTVQSLSRSVLRRLSSLRGDTRGNVAMMFALALIPMVGAVAAAVDYSRASSARTSLQSALDAAALSLSREAASLSENQLKQKALEYVQANLNRPGIKNLEVTSAYSNADGGELTLTAKASLDTTVAGVIGMEHMPIGTNSTIKWGNTKLRVSLVLDTTGSMNSDGKMPALKTAAKNLLTQLQTASTNPGDVYVSIIPFSKNVNVGSSNWNASWVDFTDWEAEPPILQASKPSNWDQIGPGSSCPFTTNSHGFRCNTTPTGTTNASTIPSSGTYRGYICPGTDGGQKDSKRIGIIYNGCYDSIEKSEVVASGRNASCGSTPNCSCSGSGSKRVCTRTYFEHNWIKNARSTWNGCVTDRGTSSGPSNDYDRKVTAPTPSITASLFPAEQNSYCSPAIMAMSENWNAMKSAIDNLYPLGATNQPIGLVWGWQSLVGGGPFPTPPAKDPKFKYNEVIVLMSDGLNTLDRWYGNGSSTNTNVDKRMYESASVGTCANAKAAGLTIYAIHVNTDGDPMSTLLKNCASSADKFWMVTNGTSLASVFEHIGNELSQLRIAK